MHKNANWILILTVRFRKRNEDGIPNWYAILTVRFRDNKKFKQVTSEDGIPNWYAIQLLIFEPQTTTWIWRNSSKLRPTRMAPLCPALLRFAPLCSALLENRRAFLLKLTPHEHTMEHCQTKTTVAACALCLYLSLIHI